MLPIESHLVCLFESSSACSWASAGAGFGGWQLRRLDLLQGGGVTQRGEDSTITAMSTYTGSHNTHISDREAEPKKKEKMVACEML